MTDPSYQHAHNADDEHVDDRDAHPRPVAAHETTTARPGMAWAAMGVRILLTLVGAAGLIVGAFMDWIQGTSGVNIDIRALWESGFDREGETFIATIGFVAIVIGLVAILGLAPRSGWLTRIAGALGIVLFVLLAIQVYRADLTVQDIEAGAWIALAGGVVALIGGFFGTRQTVMTTTAPAVIEQP
jgi:hypothetical protein